ncbi:MAG TPA: phosphoglycerate kinase [Pseudoclavibacter sp.]|nr:phosphoglycerate kinase [Pseudoclavibacter sp.]
MSLRKLSDLGDLAGKRALVRVDFNVPLADGVITDDGRIRAALPTLRQVLGAGASVVAFSHLGRPKGAPDPAFTLAPVVARLSELLGQEVKFASDTVGESAQSIVADLKPGEIAVLENLRFNPEETSKDAAVRKGFAEKIAAFGDVFISDGFGVVHRKQASVYELAQLLPSAAGLLVAYEVEQMERITKDPQSPYLVVLGGAKVSDKLGVIENLLPRVDRLIIGGGMAYTFIAAQGHSVGKSLLEADQIDACKGYLAKAKELGVEIHLPVDTVVAEGFAADAASEVVPSNAIESSRFGADGEGLDIGPESRKDFRETILSSKTIFWNGPMGVFEFPAFAEGTKAVAQALADSEGFSLIGGGDSAAAVRKLGFRDDAFGHISTGGGAGLEFLEGKVLPGLEVLGWE